MKLKLRAEMNLDPEYHDCMLRNFPGHVCGGRKSTWEHAIYWQGKRLQRKWAIVSICAKSHEVDFFQDAHTMDKKLNIWLALNRATDEELRAISKVEDYFRMRDNLNKKYGPYVRAEPRVMEGIINY